MDSRSAKRIRLGRILRPETGRSVTVAYSHGVLRGAIPGLRAARDIGPMLAALSPADAIMISPGMLASADGHFVGKHSPGLILQAEWHNIGRAKDGEFGDRLGASAPMLTAEEAVYAGADAIMSYLWLGGHDPELERDEIQRNARLARACERVGLPLLIESRGVGPENTGDADRDLDLLRFHTRVAAELGADFVKTIYSGDSESFSRVVEECPVPVLVAGGSRNESFEAATEVVRGVMTAGGAGVVYGRNIFQHPDPGAALRHVIDVVHGSPDPTAQADPDRVADHSII